MDTGLGASWSRGGGTPAQTDVGVRDTPLRIDGSHGANAIAPES